MGKNSNGRRLQPDKNFVKTTTKRYQEKISTTIEYAFVILNWLFLSMCLVLLCSYSASLLIKDSPTIVFFIIMSAIGVAGGWVGILSKIFLMLTICVILLNLFSKANSYVWKKTLIFIIETIVVLALSFFIPMVSPIRIQVKSHISIIALILTCIIAIVSNKAFSKIGKRNYIIQGKTNQAGKRSQAKNKYKTNL